MQCDHYSRGFHFYLVILSVIFIAACGTGSGEDPVTDTQTGVLLDGPTSGVTYSSSIRSGVTNERGEFTFFPGETLTFSIGGLVLGEITLTTPSPSSTSTTINVTPVELTGSDDATDPRVVRILQLLQSLDADGNHDNGIQITGNTRAAASGQSVNFADSDFEANNPGFDLQNLVSATKDPDDPVTQVVSPAQALQNFSQTIQDFGLTVSLTATYQLVWSDEFNTAQLNTDDWNVETGYGDGAGEPGAGWGNDEWQLYTSNSENLSIVFGEDGEAGADPANGYLRLSAQCPSAPNCGKRTDEITSAKINTKDKQEFQFGKIEARIKVPTGKGAWPAFWSLGAGYPETPWPAAGEMDFMEIFNVDNTTNKDALFTIHWEEPDGSGTRQFVTTEQAIDASDFRIFEAEWTENRIVGKIDGTQFASYTFDPATQSEFLNPFYLILNVAMGGNPLPDLQPDATTAWPQEMLVDYVRVYQAVGDLNAPIINIDFEGVSQFICFEDGSGCGGASGFAGGDASVQPNPDTTGNDSANAGRFQKFNPGNGEAFGGTLVRLTDDALDFDASNNIFTVKVYATRSVPVRLELGDDNPNDGSPGVEVTHTGSGWETLTFDVSGIVSQVTKFNQIVFIFDNGVIGDAGGDSDNWTFYIDDIVLQKTAEDSGPDTGTGGTGGGNGGTATGGTVPANTILAADGTAADLTTTFTGFDSGTGTAIVSSDSSYGNALEVTVANGYAPSLNLAQLFITGLSSLDSYDQFLFKVKGLTDNNLVLKIEPPGGPDVAINLASPGAGITVSDLGDGWSQVVVDLAQFGDLSAANVVIMQTLDNAYALGDTFLLTDIGFNDAGPATATGGSVPDATILRADGTAADLTTTFTGFDSGTGTAIVSSDSSYGNALEVTVANGYAPSLNLAQLFITGLSSLNSYDQFLFKVKGLTDNNLVLKIEPPGGPDVAINLASPGAGITVSDLGDGWSQVVVDLSQFGDISGANVVILQTLDNAYALGDTFLLTDIGFNTAGGGSSTGGSAVNLVAATGQAVLLKQIEIGKGIVTNGDEVTVSFDLKTVFTQPGPNVNGQIFVEVDGGGVTQTVQIPAIVADQDETETVVFTVDPSIDVSGGITLQLNAVCGGDAGCESNAVVDNVSVVIGGGNNLVVNGDFETGSLDDGWSTSAAGAGTLTIVAEGSGASGGGGTAQAFANEVLYSSDTTGVPEDFVSGVDYTEITPFGSGSVIAEVTSDPDYSRALGITSGFGYGGANVMQVAFTGFSAGFIDSYESIEFKVKNTATNIIRFKAEPEGTNPFIQIDLTTDSRSTSLGNDWYQVVIPVSEMGTVTGATQIVFEDNTDTGNPTAYQILITDIGFNYFADEVLYSSDTTAFPEDFVSGVDYTEITPFGSGSVIAEVTSDPDFPRALGVTSGFGYGGANVMQVAFTGFAAGFIDSYESIEF